MPPDTPGGALRVEDFRPVQITDRPHFDRVRLDDLSPHVLNFANLVMWQDKYGFRWGLADDHIAVHNDARGCLYVDGITAVPPAVLARWFDRYMVPPEYLQRHPDTERYFAAAPCPREQQDYIYGLDRLARLDAVGPPRFRTYLHSFTRRHPDAELRALTGEDRDDCENLYQRWLAAKQGLDRPEWEHSAFLVAWEHFEALELAGFGLFADGTLASFLIYDALTPRTMLCHFLKSDYTVRSSSTAILWLSARELVNRFDYFNFEQDLGLPGLRRYKEAMGPLAITGFVQLVRR